VRSTGEAVADAVRPAPLVGGPVAGVVQTVVDAVAPAPRS
jgi:hypothetical protein